MHRTEKPSYGNRKRKTSGKPLSTNKRHRHNEKGAFRSNNFQNEIILDPNQKIRLNKFIADSGYTSRRKADEIISEGRVKVDGKVMNQLGVRVSPGSLITIDGDPISYKKHHTYILLNKPKDYITTVNDEFGRKTIFDIVKIKQRLFPVGRLDRNSTGALLITNDGELANKLMHPSSEIEKVYKVGLDKPLTDKIAKAIAKGVELEDGLTAPCEVQYLESDAMKVTMILQEGKNREIRRIFEKFEYKVLKLDRKIFAGISTSGLNRGDYRHLSKQEVEILKKM